MHVVAKLKTAKHSTDWLPTIMCVCVLSLSVIVQLFAAPWTVAH